MPSHSGTGRKIVGIRLIVTSVTLGILATAIVSVGVVQERNTRLAVSAELEARVLLSARNLALAASSAFLSDFPELTLHPLILELHKEQEELGVAVVVDRNQAIQGHQDYDQLGVPYQGPTQLAAIDTRQPLKTGERLEQNQELLVASVPVLHPNGQVMGRAFVGVHRAYLDAILASARRDLMVVLGVALALGLLVALLLMSTLLRPLGVLRAGLERIGRGDMDTRLNIRDRTEFGVLADVVNSMTMELKSAQAELVEKERLAHELDLAREIQAGLLPAEGTNAGEFVVAGSHAAASEVGGDYFDIFLLPNGTMGVVVADVAGKGLAGCMVMSMLSSLLRAIRDDFTSPTELLVRLDERLSETLRRGSFVTLFYGILDPVTGRMTLASAGHSPTMIYRSASRSIEEIPTRGIPLGAIRGGAIRKTLEDVEVTLEPGDMLLQYTDGINEAFGTDGQTQFGVERVRATVMQAAPAGCNAVLETLKSGVADWRGDSDPMDDETLLVVSREGAAETFMAGDAPALPAGSTYANQDPAQWLEDALRCGDRLELTTDLSRMHEVRSWVSSRSQFNTLDQHALELMSTALYEACSNIAEHGYPEDLNRTFEVWWVEVARGVSPLEFVPGYFLILDQGKPFESTTWTASDFAKPETRAQGRGFGLDIIHGVMTKVDYRPGFPEGNITRLVFAPMVTDKESGGDRRYA